MTSWICLERQNSESAGEERPSQGGKYLSNGNASAKSLMRICERGLFRGLFDFGRLGHEGSFLRGLWSHYTESILRESRNPITRVRVLAGVISTSERFVHATFHGVGAIAGKMNAMMRVVDLEPSFSTQRHRSRSEWLGRCRMREDSTERTPKRHDDDSTNKEGDDGDMMGPFLRLILLNIGHVV